MHEKAVERFHETYVLPIAEARERRVSSGLVKAHVDPLLRHNFHVYSQLLASLCRRGVIEFCSEPGLEEVGLFTVSKKNNRQRLVVDARPTNFHVRDSPSTKLPMGTTFTGLSAEPDSGTFIGCLDFQEEIFSILYTPLKNFTTHIAIYCVFLDPWPPCEL